MQLLLPCVSALYNNVTYSRLFGANSLKACRDSYKNQQLCTEVDQRKC